MWGKREAFVQANVLATRNVIAACRQFGVPNVVFTSSPSVVHTGRDLINVDESIPLANHFSAFYPETKAMAESEILAEGGDTLKVTALRPHLIWGPNDTNLIPAVLTRARSGALKRVGDGTNLVDLTFIDDCVNAHLCAMRTLETSPERCNGKAYFISQGDPVSLWGWIDEILTVHGLPKVTKSVSLPLALKVAAVCEAISRVLLKLGIEYPPRFSSFLVTEMATSHYFDISAARRDLGYSPSCTIAEAMKRTFSR
jgi:nucleoside-diphosphate-sugar epimerase